MARSWGTSDRELSEPGERKVIHDLAPNCLGSCATRGGKDEAGHQSGPGSCTNDKAGNRHCDRRQDPHRRPTEVDVKDPCSSQPHSSSHDSCQTPRSLSIQITAMMGGVMSWTLRQRVYPTSKRCYRNNHPFPSPRSSITYLISRIACLRGYLQHLYMIDANQRGFSMSNTPAWPRAGSTEGYTVVQPRVSPLVVVYGPFTCALYFFFCFAGRLGRIAVLTTLQSA